MLKHGVSLRFFWIAPVIAYKQVFYSYAAPKFVAANEKVVGRPDGDILICVAVHKFDRYAGRKEFYGFNQLRKIFSSQSRVCGG